MVKLYYQTAQFQSDAFESVAAEVTRERFAKELVSGALAREARSGAPWVKKCGKLPIRENLVIT